MEWWIAFFKDFEKEGHFCNAINYHMYVIHRLTFSYQLYYYAFNHASHAVLLCMCVCVCVCVCVCTY